MTLNIAQAMDILSAHDQGTWTAPEGAPQDALTSAFVARALSVAHPDRAWIEVESLLAAQWPDGMVPHLVYHQPTDTFPASGLWVTGRPVTTSGLTALPIWGSVLRWLHECAPDAARARAALTAIDRWHGWFGTHRDPKGTGLFALLHPWESGRPEAPEWSTAFARVPTEGVGAYLPPGASSSQARTVWLIERFRSLGWETPELHDQSPFRVVDPGANALLIRSCADLAALADMLDAPEIAQGNRLIAERAQAAMEGLMRGGRYLPLDRITGLLVQTASVGTALPIWAGLPVDAQVEGPVEPWAAALVADAPTVRMDAPSPADDLLAAALFFKDAAASPR